MDIKDFQKGKIIFENPNLAGANFVQFVKNLCNCKERLKSIKFLIWTCFFIISIILSLIYFFQFSRFALGLSFHSITLNIFNEIIITIEYLYTREEENFNRGNYIDRKIITLCFAIRVACLISYFSYSFKIFHVLISVEDESGLNINIIAFLLLLDCIKIFITGIKHCSLLIDTNESASKLWNVQIELILLLRTIEIQNLIGILFACFSEKLILMCFILSSFTLIYLHWNSLILEIIIISLGLFPQYSTSLINLIEELKIGIPDIKIKELKLFQVNSSSLVGIMKIETTQKMKRGLILKYISLTNSLELTIEKQAIIPSNT